MKNPSAFKLMLLFIPLCLLSNCTQEVKEEKITITSTSENAKQLFLDAYTAYENGNFTEALSLLKKSVTEDSMFFMGNYNLAMNNFNEPEKFKDYAEKALSCGDELSEAEKILQGSLSSLLENKEAVVTETGKKLVEKYPADIIAYYTLFGQQVAAKDNEGQVSTLKEALKIAENPAILYNAMGYAYLGLEMPDSAKVVFDKYIELKPDKANPYDSKGDYFMYVKEYKMAVENFMKAYELDTTFKISLKKAEKAKMVIDSMVAGEPVIEE